MIIRNHWSKYEPLRENLSFWLDFGSLGYKTRDYRASYRKMKVLISLGCSAADSTFFLHMQEGTFT